MQQLKQKWEFIIYRSFWIFFLGGTIGFMVETVWCYFAFGGFSSRTSNLFLPFSYVWGLGCLVITMILHNDYDKTCLTIFLKGSILGSILEFICGYFCEFILGVTFWDYSALPFSIGNYVNLMFCAFWGILCILWIKSIYPWCNRIVQKIIQKSGKSFNRGMIGFMIITTLISGLALLRMDARQRSAIPGNMLEQTLDIYFPDQVLQRYFPKMKHINGTKIYVE